MPRPLIKIDTDDFEVGISSKQTNGKGFFKLVNIDITKEDGAMELAKRIVTSFPPSSLSFRGVVDNFESFVASANPYIDETLVYAISRGDTDSNNSLLLETGFSLLLEDGDKLLLETDGNEPTIYINPSTSVSWIELDKDTVKGDGRCDIIGFNNKLYGVTNGTRVFISTDGVNFTYNHHTLTTAITGKSAEFAGLIYIPHGNKLASIDVSDIFTDNAFELPSELTITDVEPFGNYLAIATAVLDASGEPIKRSAKVYFWDGLSEKASDIVDAETDGCYGLKNVDNILYLLAGKDGSLYYYNGSDFEIVRQIRKGTGDINVGSAMEVVDGDLLFGVAGDAKPVGVYSWGKLKRSGSRRTMSLPYKVEGGANPINSEIHAIKTLRWDSSGFNGRYVYVSLSYLDSIGGDFIHEVWIVQSDLQHKANDAYIITEQYHAETQFNQLYKGLQTLNRSDDFSTITLKYRIDNDCNNDDDTGWTTLGTIEDTQDYNRVLHGIYKRARRIQFRIDLSGGGTITPALTGINIY